MKVRRYVAGSMRAALDLVRDELGPDVLILGNRKVADGVEILIADDDGPYLPDFGGEPGTGRESEAAAGDGYGSGVPGRATETRGGPVPRAPRVEPEHLWTQNDLIQDMQGELHALKTLVEQQLSGFAWGAYGSNHPERALLLRHLVKLGIAPALARDVLDGVPSGVDRKTAWHRALGLIAQRLKELPESVFDDGGIFVLCGPSGVGKTSVIAKLAARRALRFGSDDITLISADNRRIGAHQQLRSIGRILGVPVHQVEAAAAAEPHLRRAQPGALTFIDTAGCFVDVAPLRADLAQLAKTAGRAVRPLLVLAANMDAATLEATLEAYAPLSPMAAVITKTDEAPTIGAVLSALIEHGLPVAFTSHGVRIPDDLEPAKAHRLIADLATRGKAFTPGTGDLGLACERGFEGAANWS